MSDGTKTKLTPQQIANWRKILSITLGPYAFMMPENEIERHRDRMQESFGEKIMSGVIKNHAKDPEQEVKPAGEKLVTRPGSGGE